MPRSPEHELGVALCLQCGLPKAGPFASCDACGYLPGDDDARTKSVILSTLYLDTATLEEFSRRIQAGESCTFEPQVLADAREQLARMVPGRRDSELPVRERSRLRFPEVEGFSRTEPIHFPKPGHGYTVTYTPEGGWPKVSVVVYNSTSEPIPDGALSDVVREEIVLVEEGLKEMRALGNYRAFKEVSRGEAVIGKHRGAPRAQHRCFEIDRADVGWIESDTYITGHGGQFVKIRASCLIGDRKKSRKELARVLDALGELLSKAK
jgi:hypothetical protein